MEKTEAFVHEDLGNGEIYKAVNTITGAIYIGQAKCFVRAKEKYIKHGMHRRWTQHLWEAKNKPTHGCTRLNKAILAYGEEKFIVEMIHKCPIDELNHWEKHYVTVYKSNTRTGGYNLTSGGDNYIRSEETLAKLSKTKRQQSKNNASKRDVEFVEKYSKLTIRSIDIKVIDNDKKKMTRIIINHINGRLDTGVRAQDSIDDAVERTYNICIQLVHKSRISLSKEVSDILSKIGKMREPP